jgi:hypothetical protein
MYIIFPKILKIMIYCCCPFDWREFVVVGSRYNHIMMYGDCKEYDQFGSNLFFFTEVKYVLP